MTQQEFISKMLGVPWQRWACSFEACDCYGLVVLYYRHVHGVELGDVPQTSLADGFATDSRWAAVDRPESGDCGFMTFRNGEPQHCGIFIAPDLLLHCDGNEQVQGNARLTRLSAMIRIYKDIKFYALDL